jgi:radical SAM enzyme (TIGR01210 family)
MDFSEIARIQPRVGFANGRSIERVVTTLRSNGCTWALSDESGGGCTMCGHMAGCSRGKTIDADLLLKQFTAVFKRLDFFKYPMLCLYNSGSFLKADEVPKKVRKAILQMIAEEDDIEHLIIECRPEYVTADDLDEIRDIMGRKRVEIGIGLESCRPEIRHGILNKGMTNQPYEDFGRLVAQYENIFMLAYVLVKPPFVSEGFAIRDAIETTDYAFDIGADVVSLEPVSIQEFTPVDLLARAHRYRVPWIWSAMEIVKTCYRANSDNLIRLGGFEFYPRPKEFVHNCTRCNKVFCDAMDRYNSTNNIEVLNQVDCSCRCDWEEERGSDAPPEPGEIVRILDSLDIDALISEMVKDATNAGRRECES